MRSYLRQKTLNATENHLNTEFKIWRQGMGWNSDNGKPWWYTEIKGIRNQHWGPFCTKTEARRVAHREIEKQNQEHSTKDLLEGRHMIDEHYEQLDHNARD
jgi:hypothetical protein